MASSIRLSRIVLRGIGPHGWKLRVWSYARLGFCLDYLDSLAFSINRRSIAMTEGEKMVWAAAYAANWCQQLENERVTGTKRHAPTAIENAWAAVIEMRGSLPAVATGWGEDEETTLMLQEMLGRK